MIPGRTGAFARPSAGSVWLVGATTVANVLAYLYQVVMARLLRPEEYAIVTAFFAVLILQQFGGQVVQSATAKLAAQYAATGEEPVLHAFVRRWLSRLFVFAGVPAGGIVLLSIFVEAAPPSQLALGMLGASLFLTIFLTFTFGLLQGLARFIWLGTLSVVLAFTQLTVGVGLVLLFSGSPTPVLAPVNGALVGATVALLVGAAGSLLPLAPLLRAARYVTRDVGLGHAETRFFFMATLVFVGYAALTFADGLAAPWLIPEEAGTYAAVVTMGKIILFAPIAVGLILLERTSRADALGLDADRYLFAALGFVIATSGAVALAFLVAPDQLTKVVVGTQYPAASGIVGLYGIAALSNALLSVWLAYFVGRGRMVIGPLLALGVLTEYLLLLTMAHDAASMVGVILVASILMQAVAVSVYMFDRTRR